MKKHVPPIFIIISIACFGCFEGKPLPLGDCGAKAGDAATNTGNKGGPCYGNQTCDPGLACSAGSCVTAPDLGTPDLAPDLGPTPDTAPDSATGRDLTPDSVARAVVVITEVMVDPSYTGSNYYHGEWLELYNAGGASVDLKGWTLTDLAASKADGGTKGHKIASTLSLAPGKYVLLGRVKDTTKNGGVTLDYIYGTSFTLSNDEDEVILLDSAGKVADSVQYKKTKGWPITKGAAMSLKWAGLDNALPGSWCAEKAKWATSTGDYGSPGAATTCTPY